MDLLNQTLNSFSTQISALEVSLNTDIFETNVINITLLVGGLFYLLSGALSESLSERQQKILGAILETEEHTSELHHTVISYAVFCLKKKKKKRKKNKKKKKIKEKK